MIGIKVVDSQNDIELFHNDFSGVYKFVDKKLSFEKKLDGNKFLVIIELNDNFHYMCRIVRKLRRLFENKDVDVTYYLISNNSKYLNDLQVCINAIGIKDRKERYTYIYDKVCDYLDEQFRKCDYCEFRDSKCVANRNGTTPYKEMGCCHSFDIASPFSLKLVENEKICKYLNNNHCSTKNISCKLHTCRYLRKKGVRFKPHKMLPLECFFNQKQHDIINLNFFRNREEILNKLMEKHYEPYFVFLMNKGFHV